MCGFARRKAEKRLRLEPRCVCGFARRKAEKRLRLEPGGASVGIRAFCITGFVVCYLRLLSSVPHVRSKSLRSSFYSQQSTELVRVFELVKDLPVDAFEFNFIITGT